MDAEDLVLQLDSGNLIHCPEGLVHEQNIRGSRQGSGDAHPLTLSAGKLSGEAARQALIQAHKMEQVSGLLPAFLPLPSGKSGDGGHVGDIFRHCHVGKQAHILNGIADMAAKFYLICFLNVLPANQYPAAVRGDQAVHQL